jgi:putative ATP-dependent endonuclease of OLD family
VPLKNLILLDNQKAHKLEHQFQNRLAENIIQDTTKNVTLREVDYQLSQKKLERYIDVTKSQLFYAKSVLFVEGISEELLLSSFTRLDDYQLEDYRVEVVNVKGTSFYPFLYLFNNQEVTKRINKPITVLTDDDRFTSSKNSEYSFDKLLETNYSVLTELDDNIQNGTQVTRIANLNSVVNNADNIKILHSFKTLEYELAIHNIKENRKELIDNFLFDYVNLNSSNKIDKILEYTQTFENDIMSEAEKRKVGILLWKALPSKADFAQDFSIHILENLVSAKDSFVIPPYIQEGLTHLRQGI